MNLKTIINKINHYDKIVVTGPARSGTAIATRILANELNKNPILEDDHGNYLIKGLRLLNNPGSFVLQSPGLLCKIKKLNHRTDIAFVIMIRPIEDIISSRKRINYSYTNTQSLYYFLKDNELKNLLLPIDKEISLIKYRLYYDHLKKTNPNCFDLYYDSLINHPFWIPKESRLNFKTHQTLEKIA